MGEGQEVIEFVGEAIVAAFLLVGIPFAMAYLGCGLGYTCN